MNEKERIIKHNLITKIMNKIKQNLLSILFSLPLLFPNSIKAGTLDSYPTFQKGASYVSWWFDEYTYPRSKTSLQELKQTNTDVISLLTTQYIDNLNSTNIHPIVEKTPTDNSLETALNNARGLGMDVMLKPHVDVGADSTTWRGYISFSNETDWQAWFNSYKNFISHYAEFAENKGIKLLCIGTELKGTTHRNEWQDIINSVRQKYSGRITYASNWDEFNNIQWFDKLDYIGIDAYFPLTNSNDSTLEELIEAWQPHLLQIDQNYETFRKPILLTEIGYRSTDGANKAPWLAKIDLGEQADCYQAAFQVLWGKPWFYGLYFWNWTTEPNQGGLNNEDYTPHGKPAENIIRQWFSKSKKTSVSFWDKYE